MVDMRPKKRIEVILANIVPKIIASAIFDEDKKVGMLMDQRSRAMRLSEECDPFEKESFQSRIKDTFAPLLGEYPEDSEENPCLVMQYPLGFEELL